ncbi:MAG TPA: SCO family protein [Candidatus Acidoferrales bacterium]|nr:SCO family protein [Candidatus Acidoferrales bacterium]
MPPLGRKNIREHHRSEIACLVLLAAFAFIPTACSNKASPPAAQEQAKRYHLVGTVVSIDLQQNSLNVDGQEIPGFMAAMTMPYPVRDAKALASLGPGDEITADVVVTDSGAYLENIVVTKKGSGGAKPTGSSHTPQPGENVPDFAFIDQDGKRIHLRSYRGDVLLVTFIYTRCPFPDFCPLVSKNFAQIYAALKKDPALDSKIRLLSVSFDPANDTPAVLKRYAETFRKTTGGDPFDRWEFAVVPAKDLSKVTDFFGFSYTLEEGQIVHSMSTTVISPAGTVYKWYEDSAWSPADLLQDAAQVLQRGNERSAGPHTSASIPTA